MLADRIAVVVAYLEAVTRGEARADPETMRGIAALLGSLLGSAEGGESAAGEEEGEEGEVRKEGLRGEFMTVRRRFLHVPVVVVSQRKAGADCWTCPGAPRRSTTTSCSRPTSRRSPSSSRRPTTCVYGSLPLSFTSRPPLAPLLDTLTPPASPRPRASSLLSPALTPPPPPPPLSPPAAPRQAAPRPPLVDQQQQRRRRRRVQGRPRRRRRGLARPVRVCWARRAQADVRSLAGERALLFVMSGPKRAVEICFVTPPSPSRFLDDFARARTPRTCT